jgi:hypothetical protein
MKNLKTWLPSIVAALLAVVLPAVSDDARQAFVNFVVANPEWAGVISTVAVAIANILRSPVENPLPRSK